MTPHDAAQVKIVSKGFGLYRKLVSLVVAITTILAAVESVIFHRKYLVFVM